MRSPQREENYQGNNVQNIQKQLTKLLQLERKINLALSANGGELSEKEEKLLKRQWESIQIEKKCMTEANKRNRALQKKLTPSENRWYKFLFGRNEGSCRTYTVTQTSLFGPEDDLDHPSNQITAFQLTSQIVANYYQRTFQNAAQIETTVDV